MEIDLEKDHYKNKKYDDYYSKYYDSMFDDPKSYYG